MTTSKRWKQNFFHPSQPTNTNAPAIYKNISFHVFSKIKENILNWEYESKNFTCLAMDSIFSQDIYAYTSMLYISALEILRFQPYVTITCNFSFVHGWKACLVSTRAHTQNIHKFDFWTITALQLLLYT